MDMIISVLYISHPPLLRVTNFQTPTSNALYNNVDIILGIFCSGNIREHMPPAF